MLKFNEHDHLTLKAPITTAADKFLDLSQFCKKDMIFHENHLQADDSHEISCLIRYLKKRQNLNCGLLQNIDGALRLTVGCGVQGFI